VKEAVAAEIEEKKLAQVALKGRTPFLDVSIAYLKGQVLSPPARAFVDTLRKLKTEDEDMHPMGIGLMMAKILAQRKNRKQITEDG
jgi:hypothetical protein